jgi:hypothetical protein
MIPVLAQKHGIYPQSGALAAAAKLTSIVRGTQLSRRQLGLPEA